ncbi:polysaccharide lyase family 7 protein [Tenacibaculum geojense]|uniref:Polysaccharide lyase family 7 protein n=1 Tax=Tenacibaculum geojense TaxID=915352 RepID=A0ABW3JSF7_9FLAO
MKNTVFTLKSIAKFFFLVGFSVCSSCANDDLTTVESLSDEKLVSPETAQRIVSSSEITVTANGDDGNKPINTLDGNLNTRWSSYGATGKYITYDLGEVMTIDDVSIAWFKGNQRVSYFQIAIGNTTSSFTTVLNNKVSGSSGSTSNLEKYELPDTQGRYVRIRGFGNSSNDWNSITEVQINVIGGSDGGTTDPDTGNSNSPAGVLGGLVNWKLNGYSGTFNRGASNNGLTYLDDTPNLENYSNSNWFYTDGTWTYFKAYTGNPTSSGSGNPRSELRELTSNGNDNIYWDGTTSTEHRMIWRVRVDHLPQSGKVCFGQIHDKTDEFDDVIRVQCQGDPYQTSGNVKLRINGYVTEVLEGGGKTVGDFNLGDELHLELTYKNSIVKLYRLDNNRNRVETIFTSKSAKAKENYFKAGCYLQSVKGKSSANSSDFALIAIRELEVFH